MIKVLDNTHKNQRLKIEAVTKMDDFFTIYEYKTEEPKSIETPTPFSLEVRLFWCKRDMLPLNLKSLPSKLIMQARDKKCSHIW